MKVVIFSSSAEPVGVAKNTLALAKALLRRGHNVCMISLNRGWLTEVCGEISLEVRSFKFSSAIAHTLLINFYLLFNISNEKDVVLHLNGRATLFSALLCFFLKRNVNYVYSVRQFADVGDPGFMSWKTILESFFMRYAPVELHAVSLPLAQESSSRVSGSKPVHFIPNFLTLTDQGAGSGTVFERGKKSSFRVIYAGRLSPEKGVDILVKSMRILVEEYKTQEGEVFLDIYGDGNQRDEIVKIVDQYNLGNFIALRGQCKNARQLFKDYDVIIIPSRSESFGLVAIEAFFEGVPVIAANIPGLRDVVGDAGLFFERERADELAMRILELKNDHELRETLRRRGIASCGEFTEDKVVYKFENLYSKNYPGAVGDSKL